MGGGTRGEQVCKLDDNDFKGNNANIGDTPVDRGASNCAEVSWDADPSWEEAVQEGVPAWDNEKRGAALLQPSREGSCDYD